MTARTFPGWRMAAREDARLRDTFAACYAEHRSRVYRWALRYAGGRSAWAEDVTAEVFVKLWSHLPELERERDLAAWLYRVTANVAVSQLRKERGFAANVARFFGRELDEEAGEEAAATVPGPDDAHEVRESAGAALAALEALPDKERIVLSMLLLDDVSQREISKTLGLSEGYVSKLVTRGLARLRAAGWEVADG